MKNVVFDLLSEWKKQIKKNSFLLLFKKIDENNQVFCTAKS